MKIIFFILDSCCKSNKYVVERDFFIINDFDGLLFFFISGFGNYIFIYMLCLCVVDCNLLIEWFVVILYKYVFIFFIDCGFFILFSEINIFWMIFLVFIIFLRILYDNENNNGWYVLYNCFVFMMNCFIFILF